MPQETSYQWLKQNWVDKWSSSTPVPELDFSDHTFSGASAELDVDGVTSDAPPVVFRNCVFRGPFNIGGIRSAAISFRDCQFHGDDVVIQNCEVQKLLVTDSCVFERALALQGCKVGTFTLNESSHARGIRIQHGSEIGTLLLQDVHADVPNGDGHNITISGSEVKNVTMERVNCTRARDMDGIVLDGAKVESIHLQHVAAHGLRLSKTEVTSQIRVEHCDFHSVNFNKMSRIERVEFTGVHKGDAIQLDQGFCKNVIVYHKLDYRLLEFHRSGLPSGVIRGCFDTLRVVETVTDPYVLSLVDVELRVFDLERFVNLGELKVIGMRFKDEGFTRLIGSDLGKLTILASYYEKLRTVEYYDAVLTGMRIVGSRNRAKVRTPPRIEYRKLDPVDLTPAQIADHERSAYAQLSSVFRASENPVAARWYGVESLLRYKVYLWHNLKSHPNGEQFFDWLAIVINSTTNRYGYSLWRAVKYMFVLSVVPYVLYCWSLNLGPNLTWFTSGMDTQAAAFLNFKILLTHYVDFLLLPLRPIDYLTKVEFTQSPDGGILLVTSSAWSRTIDICARILTAYIIYQFVQAFRKYGRDLSAS